MSTYRSLTIHMQKVFHSVLLSTVLMEDPVSRVDFNHHIREMLLISDSKKYVLIYIKKNN